jgi:hypothetical protein
MHIPIIRHLPDPPSFSLLTTFKLIAFNAVAQGKQGYNNTTSFHTFSNVLYSPGKSALNPDFDTDLDSDSDPDTL